MYEWLNAGLSLNFQAYPSIQYSTKGPLPLLSNGMSRNGNSVDISFIWSFRRDMIEGLEWPQAKNQALFSHLVVLVEEVTPLGHCYYYCKCMHFEFLMRKVELFLDCTLRVAISLSSFLSLPLNFSVIISFPTMHL